MKVSVKMLKVNDKIVETNFVGEHFMMKVVSISRGNTDEFTVVKMENEEGDLLERNYFYDDIVEIGV